MRRHYAQLAAGFEIGITAVCRHMREAAQVPSAHAQPLVEAVKTVRTKA
ncbi:hypothetical protein [Streptomyces tendae]